jgi:NAD(P)-dependent dehydrogenase (short-subunit alcohol dehydrogenase family)
MFIHLRMETAMEHSGRTYIVTGSASGIGAATARWLRARGARVIGADLHDAEVVADLATPDGRAALVEGVRSLAGARVDGVIANAGGGPAETSLALNFFGAVATLQGLRPLLAASPAPRALAVSSVAALRPGLERLVDGCLTLDEAHATATAWSWYGERGELADPGQPGLDLYGAAKQALQRWCRAAAGGPDWAGAGIALNVAALGFYDTPAAAFALADPATRAAMATIFPLKGAFPGRADEAAALLAWLAGPQNSQMTGQVLFADAGMECRGAAERAA